MVVSLHTLLYRKIDLPLEPFASQVVLKFAIYRQNRLLFLEDLSLGMVDPVGNRRIGGCGALGKNQVHLALTFVFYGGFSSLVQVPTRNSEKERPDSRVEKPLGLSSLSSQNTG